MSDSSSTSTPDSKSKPTAQAQGTLLFASLVSQQVHMALMCLGRLPMEDGSRPPVDIEMARACIDTLEMLETKTQGNLTPSERDLLQRELTALRMCFVETVDSGRFTAKSTSTPADLQAESEEAPDQQAADASETRKRFVKKYGADSGEPHPQG